MFEKTIYVPILRRRPAEISALTNMLNEDFAAITPLFEMCEHIMRPKVLQKLATCNREEYFYDVIRSLAASCGRKPYFIDFGHIEGIFPVVGGVHPLETYFSLLEHHFLRAVPVTGLDRTPSFQEAIERVVRMHKTGVCLRITSEQIRIPNFTPILILLLRRLGVTPEICDLMVDLGEIDSSSPTIEEICSKVPMIDRWRTFIVASGSFPENLSHLEKNEEHEIHRRDWQCWVECFGKPDRFPRLPVFSDYTVQYPKAPKPLDFAPNVSASIRYTSSDYWVIMRGEGVLNSAGSGYDQYWGQANLLMGRREFSGPDYSYADSYIARIGAQTTETGNARTWIEAGINRHMTFTTREIQRILEAQRQRESAKMHVHRKKVSLPASWNSKRLVLPNSPRQGYLFKPEV